MYYGAIKGGPNKWLNLERYFTLLRQGDDVQRLHYFTAMVDGPHLAYQEVYLRALATLPRVNIVLGYYKLKSVTRAKLKNRGLAIRRPVKVRRLFLSM